MQSGLARNGALGQLAAARQMFALSVQLGDKHYLMGDKPCGTDATASPWLAES
jgi:glutathione S-transferase